MSEIRKYFKDISKDCEERNIVITGVDFKEGYASGMQKVNWYKEELHKFYSEDKDNKDFIHGIYYYDDLIEFNVCEVRWYQTEEERDRKFKSKGEN
mgnify:FL=1|tara:strand:+ start:720 stop:1007 length:288 start_codon:yes stop_codon:yes gene_type:complete